MLSAEEREIMRTHPLIGFDALCRAERESGGSIAFLATAKEIAIAHHERWDGTGYPAGIAGTDIPLSARLMALADYYDAMRSARPYKPALSHEEVTRLITAERGRHFDPDVVEAFLRAQSAFEHLATQYPDADHA